MSEIGQFLKKTRKEKNISIDEIQEITKIRKRYLEAIENGEYNVLPGPFYTRAFIKNYAEALQLNPEQIFTEYAHEIPKVSSSTVETVIPKRSRNVKTTSPKVGKWLSRMVLYSFMVFVLFLIYLAAVNYWDNPREQAAENPEITGPTIDENRNRAPDTENTNNGMSPGETNDDEETEQPGEAVEPTWTRVESTSKNTTFEYIGAEKVIMTLQATNDRVWYRLTDPAENEEIDTELLAVGSEKEWDVSQFEQVVLRLGNPPGATLLVNGEPVDISDLPQPHDLIINFRSMN